MAGGLTSVLGLAKPQDALLPLGKQTKTTQQGSVHVIYLGNLWLSCLENKDGV